MRKGTVFSTITAILSVELFSMWSFLREREVAVRQLLFNRQDLAYVLA